MLVEKSRFSGDRKSPKRTDAWDFHAGRAYFSAIRVRRKRLIDFDEAASSS